MKLIVTEKNDAATQIARLLSDGVKPKQDKVYKTPVYRFSWQGEDCVAIGLRGHVLKVDFPVELRYSRRRGWEGVDADGVLIPAELPGKLPHPPYASKRKPFLEDGVDLKGWKIPALPYLVWAPLIKQPAEKEIIRSLKNLAAKADSAIIATDFDREGELIGKDALDLIRQAAPEIPVARARFSAFTKAEIARAFGNLVTVDEHLAAAGESRQFIDLIWGAVLTRYLTTVRFSGLGNVRSAGRVQTPTLALVVARERERLAFVPEDYWVISGIASKGGEEFKIRHCVARFSDKDTADAVYARALAGVDAGARITDLEKKERRVMPPAPFNTTSLQAAAAQEGLAPGRTMRLAESLYMAGLISYPRVDNTVYPASLDLKSCVRTLSAVPRYKSACTEILSKKSIRPTRGKYESTDHPPIYPTAAADLSAMGAAEAKLYNLIARRFLATLMDPAVLEDTKVRLDLGGEEFVAQGSVTLKSGFRAIYPYGQKKDEELPALQLGESVDIIGLENEAKQTEPPARYSQGKLIQEMEKRGLGTKSTRASIIDILFERNYFKGDPIEPSGLGMSIIDALDTYAGPITTPDMTAELEESMNGVALGDLEQQAVVDRSRALLAGLLGDLIAHKEDLSAAIADSVTADAKLGVCPVCGKDVVMKTSQKTRGSFAGCMGYPACSVTYPLPSGKITALSAEKAVCPVCSAPRIGVQPFRQKAYETCINPACDSNREADLVVGACPVCADSGREGVLVAHKSEKSGKRFIRCSNYELCAVSYPLPARGKLEVAGEPCPDCGAPMVVVHTARGPWKLCPNMDCPGRSEGSRSGAGTSKKGSSSSRKARASSGRSRRSSSGRGRKSGS